MAGWLALTVAGVAQAQFNPVPLTAGSFTQDIIVEKTAPPPLENYTTATLDQGTNNYANTFFEQGYIPSLPWIGLPPHGTTFISHADPNHVFRMPPSYETNNAAYVGTAAIPGTSTVIVQASNAVLNVSDPTAYSAISILWASAGGPGLVNLTIFHADGVQETSSITTIDWFNAATTYAWIAQGRVQLDGANPLNTLRSTTQTKLFNTDIFLTDTASPVTNILFSYSPSGVSTNYRCFTFAVSGSTDGVNYAPVASVSGFNFDAVVESNALARAAYVRGTTATMDAGPNNSGNTFYEQGFGTQAGVSAPGNVGNQGLPGTGTTGLPHPGTTITSGNYAFTMPASYTANNCLMIGNYAAAALTNGTFGSPSYQTGGLTITSPLAYKSLSFLNSAGNGPATNSYTIYYDDGTTQTATGAAGLISPNWFSIGAGSLIFTAAGRVQIDGIGLNNVGVSTAVQLAHNDIVLNNQVAAVTNVSFTWFGGGRTAFFAVSASTDGTHFTPIATTGFNADVIVESNQILCPGGLFTATTATMDQGTNNGGNTWFEKGWIKNGAAAPSGLPAAGSTFASLQAANRIYQMPATYTGPNSVLIDTNHQVANITPASPATYSAFAMLTAGASIGAANTMTNLCILQHLDGTSETNLFFGYDWFNTAAPPAFIANGRMHTFYSSGVSLFGSPQQPRLFETIFTVNNSSSPVTNIQVQFKFAGGSSWTTYVLAVSASAGAVPPILGITLVNGASTLTTFEGTNVVFAATVSGAGPITYQWQFSADGINWADVSNGGTISGATTPSLTNSSVLWSNAGQYRLAASNAAGSTTNGIGTLTVYSSLPDVTQPGDPITAFGGTVPAAESVDHAIDDVAQKYLNFGANGGVPFAGPAGLIVTPQGGLNTVVSAMRFFTANDATERDPADYILEGSTDGGSSWTSIASGSLNLPTGRNGTGAMTVLLNNSLTNFFQEVHFANSTPYSTYRWTVNNVRNNAAANSMQISEIELLGVASTAPPVITRQPVSTLKIFTGGSPTFSLAALGYPTNLTYQWYSNSVSIPNATSSSYQISQVQLASSGSTFQCVVTNVAGSATSTVVTLNIVAAPTNAYPVAVLTDSPVALWRLNEGPDDGLGNAGTIANDYWGGHSGVYTNVALVQPGYSANDPDTATLFGILNGFPLTADSYAGKIAGIDFSAPTNQSANFSIEAWINGPAQSYDAGIISKGAGGGGEQFTLDTGATAAGTHGIRFFVRDSAGAVHSANTGTNTMDSLWHHVVGVCDETHSNVTLYVDGLISSVATISPSNGLLNSSALVSIGSRMSSAAAANFNNQFYGTIDEAAAYNFALTVDQVRNHYFAAGIAPSLLTQPTNTAVADGTTATFYSAAFGSPTLRYQWFLSNGTQPTTLLPGMTSSNLTLPAVTAASSGNYYQVVVTNAFGTIVSPPAQLTVVSGPPTLISDIPTLTFVYAGRSFTLPVTFGGTAPFTYQWKKNGGNLNDDARISGSHSNTLRVANSQSDDTGTYQLFASNAQGGPVPSGQGTVIVESVPAFNTNGLGWTPNTGGTYTSVGFNNNVLTLTDGAASENSAFWFNAPLYIGAFSASWTYQATAGTTATLADGMAFVLQNDGRGTSALGGAGGGLGYGGITPSAALEFNLYPNNTVGIALRSGGDTGGPYNPTTPVDLSNGDLIGVFVHYANGILTVTLTDTNQATSYTASFNAGNLATTVGGDTAYVGLTGGTGGSDANQMVSNFQFIPLPSLSVQPAGPNTLLISWPASIGGYVLQSNTNLTANAGWQTVNATVNLVGGQNQVVIAPSAGSTFYRLVLQ